MGDKKPPHLTTIAHPKQLVPWTACKRRPSFPRVLYRYFKYRSNFPCLYSHLHTLPCTRFILNLGAWGGLPPHPPKKGRFNKENGLKPVIFNASPETELHYFITITIVYLTNYFFLFYNINVMVLKKWAKPESMKNTARDYRLIHYARKHPKITLRELGESLGISRQRVFQILKGEQK